MKRICTAIVAVVLLAAIPAHATTFPSLTLIYVATGVLDFDASTNFGTSVICANQSGANTNILWRFFNNAGTLMGGFSRINMPHGETTTAGTANGTSLYGDNVVSGAANFQGKVAIYSTQSGVFCSAVTGPEVDLTPGMVLPMVRFNAHPGTVE